MAVIDKISNELFLLLLNEPSFNKQKTVNTLRLAFVRKKRFNSPRVSMLNWKTRFVWIPMSLLGCSQIGQARDVFPVLLKSRLLLVHGGYMISKPHPNYAKVLFTETSHNNAFVIVYKAAINTVDGSALKPLNFLTYSIGAYSTVIVIRRNHEERQFRLGTS